jgi:hypothetical protein
MAQRMTLDFHDPVVVGMCTAAAPLETEVGYTVD